MNLKQQLPRLINCATFELAHAAAVLTGRTISGNLKISTGCITQHGTSPCCIIIYADSVANYSCYEPEGGTVCKTLADVLERLCEPEIRIADRVVTFSDAGIQVGCATVSWATVKAIAAKAP